MAANPNVIEHAEFASEEQSMEIAKREAVTLKKRLRKLLHRIFEGHEEFLGRTHD